MKITEVNKPFTAFTVMPYVKKDSDNTRLYGEISKAKENVLLETGVLLNFKIYYVPDSYDALYNNFNYFTCNFYSIHDVHVRELKDAIILFVNKMLIQLREKVAMIIFSDETSLIETDSDTLEGAKQKNEYDEIREKLYHETIFFKPNGQAIEMGAPFYWIIDDEKKELKSLNEILRGVLNELNGKIHQTIDYSQIYFWMQHGWKYELKVNELSLLSESEKELLASYTAKMITDEQLTD